MGIRASLFDLDHTLFQGNSSFQFGVYLFKKKILPLHKMIYLSGCYFCHMMGWMETSTLHEISNKVFFSGISFSLVKQASEKFLDIHLKDNLNPKMLPRLEEAKAQDHYIAIVSSSPEFLVKGIAERLGIGEWMATLYQICEDGTIGDAIKCVQGEEKANYVHELYARTGITPFEITAYTDSHLDLPLLEVVGYPVVVNPTAKLRKIAKQFAWEVIE